MSATEREAEAPRDTSRMPDKAQLAHYYHQMLAIRRMEEALAKAYALRKFGGFLHLYIGQEALAVGALAALKPEDYVIATYREHAHAYAKGMSAKSIIAELYGKETGASKGLGGSMHLFDAEKNFLGGYGIVGGHIPLAAGTAFASKYRADGRVTMCFFGDGSVPQGAFHEGVALAALWRLPVVFICENNLYGEYSPLRETTALDDIAVRAKGYGIPGVIVDGQDVDAVHEATAAAVARARAGEGPSLLEFKTYRYRGHSRTDPAKYRAEGELERWKERDPIAILGARLVSEGVASSDEQREWHEQIQAEVDASAERAAAAPVATFEEIEDYVYASRA
jgi:pyruvate dehydrogenase E1 component alpha subunit